MTVSITHPFVSTVVDLNNPGEVGPTDWNATHTLSGAAALTKVDDTNVTLTLGGTPSTALLEAVSLTLGWTGTLANSRLTNSSVTISGHALSLGGSLSLAQADISSLTTTDIATFAGLLAQKSQAGVSTNVKVDNASATGYAGLILQANNKHWLLSARAPDSNALRLYYSPDGGSSYTGPWLNFDATGISTFYNSLNISGVTGTNSGINVSQVASGTATSPALNNRLIASDQINGGSGFVFGEVFTHSFGGGATQGGRQAFTAIASLDAPTNAANTNHFYVAGTFLVKANGVGDGGGVGTEKGQLFALNPYALAMTGATNLVELSAVEVDMDLQTGASALWAAGLKIAKIATSTVQGSAYDVGLWFANQLGATGWKDGILFDDAGIASGAFPIASTGNVLRTGAGTVDKGIDLSATTISTAAFKSNGFLVDGSGIITSAKHIGGSGTTGTQLTFQTTTGNGTTDSFAFNGGNNGGSSFGVWSASLLQVTSNAAATPTGLRIINSADGYSGLEIDGGGKGWLFSKRLNADSDVLQIYNATTPGSAYSGPWLTLSPLGNIVIGNAALSTSATDGFLYIPTCAGAPTGVPTAFTGRVAMIYDTTNNKFYFYSGGWKKAQVTAVDAVYA